MFVFLAIFIRIRWIVNMN
jgi:pimeloyl-ACP methyl ester carboxylesterase